MNDRVILVNEHDHEVGNEEKLTAHQKGLLHRAFSIFIFNTLGKMLIHKRASGKYHSGGLWTNACCSHPRPGETLEDAVHRRLKEEFGFDCPLKKVFSFIYKAHIPQGNLTEHEYDHVFEGTYDQTPQPNPEEIEDFAWIAMDELVQDVKKHPEKYTYWFKIALKEYNKRNVRD